MLDVGIRTALIVGTRFAVLLGLALWLGLTAAALLVLPFLRKRSSGPDQGAVVLALTRRLDLALLAAAALVMVALAARVVLDRAAPPNTLLLPVVAMLLARALKLWTLFPAMRALRGRAQSAEGAPPDDQVRDDQARASRRLEDGAGLLLMLELCLCLYALYAVS